MKYRIGATAWQLSCEPEKSLEFIKEAGLSFLQLDLGSAKKGWPLSKRGVQKTIEEEREKTGVEILSVVLNDLCENGFSHPETNEKSEIAQETMRLGVEAAAALGINSICVPSFFDNSIREPADYERTVSALRVLCGHAAKYGILVYTENVLPAEALAGLFTNVGCENLRLLFDTQNYPFMAKRESGPIFKSVKSVCGDFLHVKDGISALSDAPLGKGNSHLCETLEAIVSSRFSGIYLLENRYDSPQALRSEADILERLLTLAELSSL